MKGKTFKGNRSFISIANERLNSCMEEQSGNTTIEVDGVSPLAFEECLRLLGGAKVYVKIENCIDLLVAAVNLQIPVLKNSASKYIYIYSLCIYNSFIIHHINEQIVTLYLKNLDPLSKVDEVEDEMLKYLVQHGHRYFDNSISSILF